MSKIEIYKYFTRVNIPPKLFRNFFIPPKEEKKICEKIKK